MSPDDDQWLLVVPCLSITFFEAEHRRRRFPREDQNQNPLPLSRNCLEIDFCIDMSLERWKPLIMIHDCEHHLSRQPWLDRALTQPTIIALGGTVQLTSYCTVEHTENTSVRQSLRRNALYDRSCNQWNRFGVHNTENWRRKTSDILLSPSKLNNPKAGVLVVGWSLKVFTLMVGN